MPSSFVYIYFYILASDFCFILPHEGVSEINTTIIFLPMADCHVLEGSFSSELD